MEKNPENLSELNVIKVTSEVKTFVNDLSSKITECKSERAWWEQQVDKYTNLRYGIRAKKVHPWPNCANYMIPQIDADIQRFKPSYVNLISSTPIVTFEPFGPEDIEPAKAKEYLFDWRVKTHIENFFENYVMGIDLLLTQGAVVYKTTWKYATRMYSKYINLADLDEKVLSALYDARMDDMTLYQIVVEEFMIDVSFEENVKAVEDVVAKFRKGKVEFELDLVEEAYNAPSVIACNIREDITFPVDTTDLNQARFIDYVFTMSKNDIKIAMKDEKYEKYSDDVIDSWSSSAPDIGSSWKQRSRDVGKEDEMIWLHETCVWYDINNDGIEERCIVTWPHGEPDNVLRFIELPYDHYEWPYTLVKRELNDSGALASRGIPALDEDFQNGISTFFNQVVDNGTITNTPIMKYTRNSLQNPRNLRYVPGQALEINGPTSNVEITQLGNNSQGFLLQAAQYLKSWADMRIGNMTSGLTSPLNMQGAGGLGNKTKKEVDVVESLQQEVHSLDLQVFQRQMVNVYYQIDALYDQYGPEDQVVLITGQRPVKISRKEIQGKYNIVPNGRLDNTNPALRAQKSFMLLRTFLNDPDVRQYELKQMFFDDLDVKITKKLLKTREELANEAQLQAQALQNNEMKMKQNAFQARKVSDDLDIRKEVLLTPVTGRKYGPG